MTFQIPVSSLNPFSKLQTCVMSFNLDNNLHCVDEKTEGSEKLIHSAQAKELVNVGRNLDPSQGNLTVRLPILYPFHS